MNTIRPGDFSSLRHPRAVGRRAAIQAGAVGLLGLGVNHLRALQASAGSADRTRRSVIYIFLSGGLAQQDSFDPKPDAPESVRGEFQPIGTRTAGVHVCEHLPKLAQISDKWSLVRSLTHPYNEHSQGHMVMLTGRTRLPAGFNPSAPTASDWPSIASVAAAALPPRDNLPPAVVLPERLIHRTGRVIPGQFAGKMGPQQDPWFVEAAPFNAKTYGAFPEYEFHHERGRESQGLSFQAPQLSLPGGLSRRRLADRLHIARVLDRQRRQLERAAAVAEFDRFRQSAVSMLTDPRTRQAFDISGADPRTLDRYGRNSFGWSLLMARQLVEAGVPLVQVNLGNNETWDTHQAAFPNLKNFLLPPMDQSVSALLQDLDERGLLASTLVVMGGEFGRTPRIFKIPNAKLPGRDHWGAVQTVLLAGGGVQGGRVVGASDRQGGFPAADPQTPERLAATIYQTLGLPRTAAWHDEQSRPHLIYHGQPIEGLT